MTTRCAAETSCVSVAGAAGASSHDSPGHHSNRQRMTRVAVHRHLRVCHPFGSGTTSEKAALGRMCGFYLDRGHGPGSLWVVWRSPPRLQSRRWLAQPLPGTDLGRDWSQRRRTRKASASPSPKTESAIPVTTTASPGKRLIHQALAINVRPSVIMAPHSGLGGRAARPR